MNTEIIGIVAQVVLMVVLSYPLGKYIARVYRGKKVWAAIERKHILKVLQHTHGNKTETARLLKIGLATLYRKIDSYGIQ